MFLFSLATPANADELNVLVNSVYRGETGMRSWTGEAHLLDGQRIDTDRLREIMLEDESVILVARTNSTGPLIIGCVHLRREKDHAYLGMLTADIGSQRSGLGSALLIEAERYTGEVFGLRKIRMTVISLRTELIAWYAKRGYQPTGQREPFPYGNARFGLPKRPDLEFVVLSKNF